MIFFKGANLKYVFLTSLLFASLFSVSCVSMPGDVRYSESKAEGTKELAVDLGWVASNGMKVGVFKNSEMEKDKATLEVCLYSNTIGTEGSLLINIDGDKTIFKSFDKLSLIDKDTGNQTCFKKRYGVTLSYLQKMVAGKSVWLKANTNNGTYIEGEFSKDGLTTAKTGFIKFLSQINMATGEILDKPAAK